MIPRFRSWALALASAGIALLAAGCGGGPPARQAGPPGASDTARTPAPAAPTPAPPDTAVHAGVYRVRPISDAHALRRLAQSLGSERFLLALKVNRRDSLHVKTGDSLMVPDSSATLLGLAPFPHQVPSTSELDKLILVSRRVQAFAAYEHGRLTRWGPTSTGRESLQTPEGLYHTNWKDAERTSTFNEEWLLKWYVNLDSFLGISFHLFELPGYPASHSCIRLMEDDAIWLYGWADQWTLDATDRRKVVKPGTPVVIFGRYAYGKKAPWRRLAADSSATNVPLSEIETALQAYLRSGRPTPIDSVRVATLRAIRQARAARARAADSTRTLPAP
jgi:lipoprotein-anchoring transpeptidase ErfK/SrfK